MPEKKVSKETLYLELDAMSDLERKEIMTRIMLKYGFTESTAATYYAAWKKEFMKFGHTSPKLQKTKENVIEAHKKDSQKDIETKIIPDKPSLPEIEELEELEIDRQAITEIIKGEEEITDDNLTEFIPLTFKGKHYTYEITKENLLIEEGQTTIITKEGIEEQQEALEIWEKYKELV